jgi:hypothetical protein
VKRRNLDCSSVDVPRYRLTSQECGRGGIGVDTVDESNCAGFRSVDPPRRCKELERIRQADEARKALCPTKSSQNAEARSRVSEYRSWRRDSRVAREREVETATKTVPVDCGENALRHALDSLKHPLTSCRECEGFPRTQVREFTDVGTCSERFASGADQDDRPSQWIAIDRSKRRVEGFECLDAQRVEVRGAIDC